MFIHGDQSKPHLLIEVAGSGQFPRLTFDVPEVVLPPVSKCTGIATANNTGDALVKCDWVKNFGASVACAA